VILLVRGNIWWGGEKTKGKIRQIEFAETASFAEVEPLNVYQSTHTDILLAALIFPK
jgi:hypothetical protein